MKEFRTGLAGCGLFGESPMAALRTVPGVQVAVVYDINRERAAAPAEKYRVPVVAGSLEEFLAEPVDIVDVATPEDCHREPVVAAL